MRIGSVLAVMAVAGLGLAVAGCDGTTGGGTAAGSPGPSSSSAGSSGSAASGSSRACVVGSWRATGLDGQDAQDGASGSVTGGGGATMNVAPTGHTVINFDGTKPIEVSGQAAGVSVRGSITYGGQVAGDVNLPQGTVSSGSWQPTGPVDVGTLTVTVDLATPVQARLADKTPVRQYVGNQLGGVDPQPLLRPGTFECTGSTLRLTLSGQPVNGVWVLERA